MIVSGDILLDVSCLSVLIGRHGLTSTVHDLLGDVEVLAVLVEAR